MSDRVTEYISYEELLTHFGNAEEIIEELPKNWQIVEWQSILSGTSTPSQLNTTDNPLSPEQIKLYEELNKIISKANLATASNSDKAIASIYRAAIALNRLLPKDLAKMFVDSIKFQSEFLDLSYQKINDQQAVAIAAILPCTNIATLNLMKNDINDEGAIALAKLNLLTSLNLNYNSITNDQVAIALGNNKSIVELYLAQSQFTHNGHGALLANKYIRILSLNKCQINSQIAILYARSESLYELHLDENNLDVESLTALANNESLLKLSVRYNNIGDTIAAEFAKTKTLRFLDLSYNQITSLGAKAFINTTIETLILSNNKLDNVTPLALSSNPNLKCVDLSHNALTTEAIKTIYESNPTIGFNTASKTGEKPDFPSLRRLSTFAVKNIPNIPDAVLEKLPADIRAYLKQHKV